TSDGSIYVHETAGGGSTLTDASHKPFLPPDYVRIVLARAGDADVMIPCVNGQYETMHALYAKACLAPMEARLRAGQLRIVGFFPDVRVLEIDAAAVARHRAPEVAFMNVNTPDELAQARALAAEIG